MKYLFILATLLIAGPAVSQEQSSTAVTIQTTVVCDLAEKMSDVLTKQYNEIPYASGKGVMVVGTTALQGDLLIWGNVNTKTFSVTVSNQDKMCMIINGTEFGRPNRADEQES